MLTEREKQTYLLGYMKCVNEIMSMEYKDMVTPEKLATFNANMLVEMSEDLKIKIPSKEVTNGCTEIYHQMGEILDLWSLR